MYKDFKKSGSGGKSFGGPKKFGGGNSWSARPSDGGYPKPQLHKATCAECGDPCMVPFKPNGKKPIFCSNCFVKEEGGSAPKRFEGGSGNGASNDQMKAIISRLDTIIKLLSDEE